MVTAKGQSRVILVTGATRQPVPDPAESCLVVLAELHLH